MHGAVRFFIALLLAGPSVGHADVQIDCNKRSARCELPLMAQPKDGKEHDDFVSQVYISFETAARPMHFENADALKRFEPHPHLYFHYWKPE